MKRFLAPLPPPTLGVAEGVGVVNDVSSFGDVEDDVVSDVASFGDDDDDDDDACDEPFLASFCCDRKFWRVIFGHF